MYIIKGFLFKQCLYEKILKTKEEVKRHIEVLRFILNKGWKIKGHFKKG